MPESSTHAGLGVVTVDGKGWPDRQEGHVCTPMCARVLEGGIPLEHESHSSSECAGGGYLRTHCVIFFQRDVIKCLLVPDKAPLVYQNPSHPG